MKKYLLDGNVIEPNKPFAYNDLQYAANWTQLATPEEIAAIGMVECIEPPAPLVVPESVSMRQARLALLGAGLLDSVNAAIASLSQAAQIEWEYATEVRRDSQLVAGMTQALGLTSAQLDDLFTQAASL